MTEGIKSKAKVAGLLREELEALQRQRDQYALAMDTATEPKVAIRLQRTLERIEDEIEGVEETIAGLPDVADADAELEAEEPAAEPDPQDEDEAETETAELEAEEPAAEPDSGDQEWDDEPSTAIYDPESVRAQLAELEAMQQREAEEEAQAEAAAEEPVQAPVPTPQPEPEPEANLEEEDPSGEGNPLGPVWMDPVSPPAGNLSDDEIAEAAEIVPDTASPDVLGDDPFALPSRPAATAVSESSSPFGSPAGAGPFGAAPDDAPFRSPAASDFANPVSVLDDDVDSGDWGFGAKAALFLVVAGFVAGAFYIMSIG